MRLIDADALMVSKKWGNCTCPAQVIHSAPTIEAEPVKHGRWVKKWHDNSLIGHEYEECPDCGCIISDTEKFWDCNYCPNCGAKMDLEG